MIKNKKKITQILRIVYAISIIRHPKSARTSYLGTSVVIEAVPDLLEFPKLAEIYYTVLQSLFQNHIDKLPFIPEYLYVQLLGTIEKALTHPDLGTFAVKCTLESLVFLLNFHFNSANSMDDKSVQFFAQSKARINPFLPKVFEFLLSGDVFNSTITEPAGTVFFAFMCFDNAAFKNALERLKNEQPVEVRERVLQAFNGLVSVTPVFNQQNRTNFMVPFNNFLTVYRGLVKKK